jgi:hypothetical protein
MLKRWRENFVKEGFQLGRGLRRCKDKEYLNVLDFIGNYEKAGRTRFLLMGRDLGGKWGSITRRTVQISRMIASLILT